MKHTKEPWKCDKYNNVNDANGRTIKVQGFALSGGSETWANSQRIVACINACTGLTNEQLESGYIQELIQFKNNSLKMIDGFVDSIKIQAG